MDKSVVPMVLIGSGFALFFLGYLVPEGLWRWVVQIAGVVDALAGFAVHMQSKNQ